MSIRQALAALVIAACVACGGDAGEDAGEDAGQDASADAAVQTAAPEPIEVANAGLETPESVLHDEAADVYLVSNIAGEPLGRDDNGFISRVAPDGTVQTLRWIDGAAEDVTLNAPKGLALKGDTLFVSDIDVVRMFDRNTGSPLGERPVPGAAFLNDPAIGPDGLLYVTDTGVDASFQSTGAEAVYRLTAGGAERVAEGAVLAGPNGLVVTGDAAIVAPFGAAAILRAPLGGGAVDTVATLPAGQLDGLVRLEDGTLLVSSWESSTVYRIGPEGVVGTVATDLQSPADIGYDRTRRRVLVPLFMGNALRFVPVQ